ncbi:MAG: trypsin-like peptidase domain-containing protein, partial [Anaerolineae bacterium]|nr:trypsin-like peptidase domain-containing protein [Anaerolineae bacterium]
AIWYRDGTPIEVVEGGWDVSVLRSDGWAQFLALERLEGLESGQYRLELYIAERLEQEAEFSLPVTAPPPSPTNTLLPTSTPLPINTPLPTNTLLPTSTPVPTQPPLPGQAAMEALPAAVCLEVPDDDGNVVGYASGSIIDHRGWILTNLHVLTDRWTGELVNSQGIVRVRTIRDPDKLPDWTYVARLANWDTDLDIAVLQIISDAHGRPIGPALSLPSVRLGDSDRTALPVLSLVTVIGFPSTGGGTVTVTQGRVAGRRCLEDGPWIKYTASTSPGSSGSMVLNEMGRLVGVHTGAISDNGACMGYMRPINEVRSLIAQTLEGASGVGELVVRGKERILHIVYTGSDGVNLRIWPSLQADIVDVLYAGERMYVIVPGKLNYWWAVYDGKSRIGWIRELALSGLRLAQIETQDFESILRPGDMAEIMCLSMEEGHGCLNMRRTPGWRGKAEGDIVTELDGGAMVEIMAGPQEADGLIWWRVLEIATGLEDWVVETTVSGNRTLFPVR